jgi:deoxycytidylate deaminase
MTGSPELDTLYGDDLIGRLHGQSDAVICPAWYAADRCYGHEADPSGWLCTHKDRDGTGYRYVEYCATCRPKTSIADQAARAEAKHAVGLTDSQTRPDRDAYAFRLAEEASTRSTCSRARIGGVAVTGDHRIVATAYNGAASGRPHCVDLPEPVVFAGHDMLCEHTESNLAEQLRTLFDSVLDALGIYLPPGLDKDGLFHDWVRSLDLTIYLYGPRDVCTDCARKLWRIGIRNDPKVRHP